MKIDNVERAAKAVKDYNKLLAEIEHFNTMRWFRVHGGSDRSTPIPLTDAVGLKDFGTFGDLADKIRLAMIEYYEAHKRIAEAELTQLGIVF